jgi:hypothetical protein
MENVMAVSNFMSFWKTVNALLAERNQPEMLYGEARNWFDGLAWGL